MLPLLFREKKLLVSSEDYGRDLTGVQNLRKKHKRLEAELAAHEPAIQVSGCLLLREQGHEEGTGYRQSPLILTLCSCDCDASAPAMKKQQHVCSFESRFLCVTLAGVELLM